MLSYVYKKNCRRSMSHMRDLVPYNPAELQEKVTERTMVKVDKRVTVGLACFGIDLAMLGIVASNLGKQYPGDAGKLSSRRFGTVTDPRRYVVICDDGTVLAGNGKGYSLDTAKAYAQARAKAGVHGVIRSALKHYPGCC